MGMEVDPPRDTVESPSLEIFQAVQTALALTLAL